MKIRSFLLSLLLNKRQRTVIWNAMEFSEHTYRRRKNIDGAVIVKTVLNETEKLFGVVKQNYTKNEVDEIMRRTGAEVAEEIAPKVEKLTQARYRQGFEDGQSAEQMKQSEREKKSKKRIFDEIMSIAKPIVTPLSVGTEIDLERCKKECDNHDECNLYILLAQHDKEEEKEMEETGEQAGKTEEKDDSDNNERQTMDESSEKEKEENGAGSGN